MFAQVVEQRGGTGGGGGGAVETDIRALQGAGGVVFGEPPAVGRVRAGERDDPAADGLEPGPDGGIDRG
jgi:hypothetical protein